MKSFPSIAGADEFRAWRQNPSNWLPAAMDIARSHNLPYGDPKVFGTGTNLVVALDEKLVLKVFPPILRQQFLSERATLLQLQGRVDVAIPEVILAGERDRWSYLVITRLDGVLGSEAWPGIPEDQKEIVLGQIGETIAQVQRAPLGELELIEPKWERFMARQIENCRERHRGLGLPQKFLSGLDRLLEEAPTLIPMNAPAVILTGEYIPENFLLQQGGSGWRVAGLFDFGDVLTGWGEYDLLGPSAFMAAGRPGRVRSLLGGFGRSHGKADPLLTRRLLALMFLHRASDPLRHICIPGWQHAAQTLDELERMVWPL